MKNARRQSRGRKAHHRLAVTSIATVLLLDATGASADSQVLSQNLRFLRAELPVAAPAEPQIAQADADQLGAQLEPLLELVRGQNPAIAAKALETEAAIAEIEIVGSLEDPEFSVSFEDIDAHDSNPLPARLGSIFYEIEQKFPLWGKRDLRRDVARAGVTRAREEQRLVRAEIEARLKTAFAEYYLALEAIKVTREIRIIVDGIVELAELRYAQGLGGQADAVDAQLEQTALLTELANFGRDVKTAQARINALLDRPAGGALAEPEALRPLPGDADLRLDELLAAAGQRNPQLASIDAEILAERGTVELVDRSWYPDLTVGFTVVDRDRDLGGYEARIGVNIPLQWGLRDAQKSQAMARVGAAEARLRASFAEIRSALERAYWGLETTRQVEANLRDNLLPQSELFLAAAQAGYQVGQQDLSDVLAAERRLRQARLDYLRVRLEQQLLLAEIERLIGGDL
jgi:outer membrane protein TolC